MCPQKWYASASPGSMTALIAEPAVTPRSPAPTRASRPRREVERARSSVSFWLGMRRPVHAPLRRREHRLELRERVERPLREHRAFVVEGQGERGPRDPEARPVTGVADLVEADHAEVGVAGE